MALSPDILQRIAERFAHLTAYGGTLVIDGDVHPTQREDLPEDIRARVENDPNYYHGRPLLAEDLVATLDLAGVDMALCWHNPAVLPYCDDQDENYRRLYRANGAISALARQHPDRVIPAGWTDPKALGVENACRLARECVADFAMSVVKMNPAQNEYPIDDPMVLVVVDTIVGMGAVPAFHFGGDSLFTPPEGLRAVARHLGEHPVIGVHMGGGGGHFVAGDPVYIGARKLGLDCPNVFYVLSAIRDPHIESALLTYAAAGAPYSENLAVGSDAPYGNMVWNFGGMRALLAALGAPEYRDRRLAAAPHLIDAPVISGVMGGNLARLVAAADARVLARAASDAGNAA